MRTITKDVGVRIGEDVYTFQLKKMDAFSGMGVLRLLKRYQSDQSETFQSLYDRMFMNLSREELCELTRACMNHICVKLPGGWQPVMMGADWGWPDLEYDLKACQELMHYEVLWTMQDFFVENVSTSPAGT